MGKKTVQAVLRSCGSVALTGTFKSLSTDGQPGHAGCPFFVRRYVVCSRSYPRLRYGRRSTATKSSRGLLTKREEQALTSYIAEGRYRAVAQRLAEGGNPFGHPTPAQHSQAGTAPSALFTPTRRMRELGAQDGGLPSPPI